MRKMHVVIMALFVAVLFVSGCTGGGGEGEKTTTPVDKNEIPQKPPTPPAADDTLSKEATNDITNVDNANSELTDTDVDNLDKDLLNVDW